jgi:hypothetical protein
MWTDRHTYQKDRPGNFNRLPLKLFFADIPKLKEYYTTRIAGERLHLI